MAGRDTVQALERGLKILEAVAESEDGLALSALASRLGVRPPTAFNLARTLTLRGYLDKSGAPVRYRVGPAVPRLARQGERRRLVREGSALFIELARRWPDATLVLAEPVGGELIAMLRMDTTMPNLLERVPHWTMPPYTTAVSLCYLAFWPLSETSAYRRRHPFAEFGKVPWGSERRLEAFLAEARRQGFVRVVSDRPYRVAAPVRAASGQCVAAFGISLHETGGQNAKCRQGVIADVKAGVERLTRILAGEKGSA